jgi:chemotaxis protein MotB
MKNPYPSLLSPPWPILFLVSESLPRFLAWSSPWELSADKKKVSHGGHHGGAWKVAYADFVTAMMALFIVLWLMNSSNQIKQAVGGYFKDPTGNSKMVGSDMKGAGENFIVSKDNMKELKEQLQKSIREIPKFDELQNHIDMTVTNEGLRIELTETATGIFFESGSDRMSGDGSDLVKLLAQELGKLPNPIAIEGHTDSKPYPPGAVYTNWELSSDRANCARRLMQNTGIHQDQITQVRGFADQRLRKPESPLDPSNRRVSLIVQYMNKPETGSSASTSEKASGTEGKSAESNRSVSKQENNAKTK